MASLFKPVSRCLVALRQSNNLSLISAVQQRFSSSNQTTGGLDKPIDKKAVDPIADPKETCMNLKFKL